MPLKNDAASVRAWRFDGGACRIAKRCVGLQASSPDETTVLHFRRLPKRHGPTPVILAEANAYRSDKRSMLRSGTPRTRRMRAARLNRRLRNPMMLSCG